MAQFFKCQHLLPFFNDLETKLENSIKHALNLFSDLLTELSCWTQLWFCLCPLYILKACLALPHWLHFSCLVTAKHSFSPVGKRFPMEAVKKCPWSFYMLWCVAPLSSVAPDFFTPGLLGKISSGNDQGLLKLGLKLPICTSIRHLCLAMSVLPDPCSFTW